MSSQHTNVLKRQLPLLERHEPLIPDSSSIQAFKQCNRLYFYQYVLAKVPKGNAVYIYFGDAYHRFREILSKRWVEHISNNGTLGDFPDSYLGEAITEALQRYENGGPEPSATDRWAFLTKARLLLTCKYAYQHWKNEKKKGEIKVLQSEVASNFRFKDGTVKSFRMDELIEWNGKLWVRDFKCSSKNPAFYKYGLPFKDQPYTYIIAAGKHTGRKVEGIMFEQMYNEKSKKGKEGGQDKEILVGPEIHTHIVSYTASQLEAYQIDHAEIMRQIAHCREVDIYPMVNAEYNCPHCSYKSLCLANNENQMMAFIISDFKTHVWDNTKTG